MVSGSGLHEFTDGSSAFIEATDPDVAMGWRQWRVEVIDEMVRKLMGDGHEGGRSTKADCTVAGKLPPAIGLPDGYLCLSEFRDPSRSRSFRGTCEQRPAGMEAEPRRRDRILVTDQRHDPGRIFLVHNEQVEQSEATWVRRDARHPTVVTASRGRLNPGGADLSLHLDNGRTPL